MYPRKIAEDTAKVLQSYLTYQAVRTIVDQLSETNPTLAIWLRQYTSNHDIQNGEAYLEGLMLQNKELLLRILTVREHLAETVLDFLPGMVRNNINEANVEHRRHLLERLTQSQSPDSTTDIDNSDRELDINESSE
jgi:hypothetical protein